MSSAATAQTMPNTYQQFRLANGNPCANGSLYSYQAGTTTPQSTYTSESAAVANANPTVLSSTGTASVWLRTDLSYKLQLVDQNSNVIWTVDNISIFDSGSIDRTKLQNNLAGVALYQDPNNALAVKVDQATLQINGSNQIIARTSGLNTSFFSSLIDVTNNPNQRDLSLPGMNQQIPQVEWSSPTLLTQPGTIPGGAASVCKWSPNGEFLAVGCNASPYILIYQRGYNGVLTKLSNPATTPGGTVTSLSWSPCGDFLAVKKQTTPFFIVYQRTGNSFTALAGLSAPSLGTSGINFAFSPNSDFLAYSDTVNHGLQIGHYTQTYINERSGTTFTDISSTCGITGVVHVAATPINAWSPDSSLFATSDLNNGGIDVYIRTDATFTLVGGPAVSAYVNNINDFSFSPDGNFFAVALAVSPYIAIFPMTLESAGFAFGSQLSNPSILPAGAANCITWSPNSEYLLVGHANSPYMTIYSVSGQKFTKIADPVSLPVGPVTGASWNWTKQFLAVTSGTTPYIQVYQTASALSTKSLLYSRVTPYVS